MRQFLDSLSLAHWLIAGGAIVALLTVILVWWLLAGAGPRRRRGVRQARKLMAQHKWFDVLALVPTLRAIGRPNDTWQKTFNQLEGNALQAAAADKLEAKDYAGALTDGLQAARLLEDNPLEPRLLVQNAILEEARRLFSNVGMSETAPILEMLQWAHRVQTPCREASFWQALCALRDGDAAKAADYFHVARTGMERSVREESQDAGPPSPILEPPLYLGALLLRQGKAKEAMRYFTEANRLDASCPLVPLHLGCAMVAAGSASGGDMALAVRTLQKAIGPKGLGAWANRPTAFWAEVYPENRSYVRKLATKYRFHCPLWGETPTMLLRQGQLALAQALQKQGQHKEAAELFGLVLKDGAPSQPVLRGYGLAQARLGRFDEAYKALRQAYELEDPKDRLTAGYLALSAVKSTPENVHDVPTNLAWAVKTVIPFSAPGDAEWVDLIGQVFEAARTATVPLVLDDQLYLCEHLASVHAADLRAAAAFRQMFDEHPQLARSEYSWLYAQAIAATGALEGASLPLLERALHEREAAKVYFTERGWNWEAVERIYLLCAAKAHPGQIPTIFGEAGLQHAERLLLEGSRQAEERGDLEEARTLVEAFSRLVPHHPGALDRLAALHFRGGRAVQAIAALVHWRKKSPDDPLPLVRLALVRGGAGEANESLDLLAMARNLAVGPARPQIALVAARLALRHWRTDGANASEANAALLPTQETPAAVLTKDAALNRAEHFLKLALTDDPACGDAAALLAAIRWLKNDEPGLVESANQYRAMQAEPASGERQPPEGSPPTPNASAPPTTPSLGGLTPPARRSLDDPRLQYFIALALSAARDWPAVVAACRRVTHLIADKNGSLGSLANEAAYLEGVAQSELGDAAAATEALQKPAAADGASAPFAQGLIGAMLMQQGQFDAATTWWQKLPTHLRTEWKIGEALGGAQMLAALEAFQSGRFEIAADKFRQAGKLGCRDRRLGGLLLASLVKAGKQAVYGDS